MLMLYEGKSKRVYVKNQEELLMEFKDEVTAMDGAIKAVVSGKGVINARLSAYFFEILEKNGVKTHYIDYDGGRVLTVKKLTVLPIEVIVRNYAYGSLLKRMPLYKPLQKIDPPLVEFHFKDDSLHDPLILSDDLINTNIVSRRELEEIVNISLEVNAILSKTLLSKNLRLIDIKLEFGKDKDGFLVLADEISGDTFRVMDENNNHLDKEIFRKTKDANLLIKAYASLCQKLGVSIDDVTLHR